MSVLIDGRSRPGSTVVGLPPIDRVIDKLLVGDDCWVFLGAKDKHGYGHIARNRGSSIPAHHITFEFFRGQIPPGKELDHTCVNPPCARPSHLDPVTHLENIRRGGNSHKTECPSGHAYSDENTSRDGLGRRYCKACRRERARERRARAVA